MATSSITRNFVVEGQDAVDFANSLDLAFAERVVEFLELETMIN